MNAGDLLPGAPANDTITIVSIYPVLLGTYGDGGNVTVLLHRARLRGIPTRLIEVEPGDPVPAQAEIYVLGGGEDTAQVAAAESLRRSGALARATREGAAVLAICAGYQLLGLHYPDAEGNPVAGLGLLDAHTDRLPRRAVGELVFAPDSDGVPLITDLVTGYENHAGATHLGPDACPLGRVRHGIGNGDGTEGAIHNRILGTYAHGPALARNPQIADQLLAWATGQPLAALDEPEVAELRRERLRAVLGSGHQ